MPSKYLIPTTARPEGYFGGLQRLHYMNGLDPLTCPSGPFYSFASGMTSIGWTSVCGETVGSHVYAFPAQKTQGTASFPSKELLARVFCHFIISALPEEALPELAEDLNDIGCRYLRPARAQRQLVQSSTPVKAKIGKTIARPEIQIDTE